MSKKNADSEKDEEKDLDEEEEDEDEDEEEEAEAPAASVKASKAPARPRPVHTEHDDDDGEDEDGEDPYWWTPHAVMSALVLIGVLGFFGVFNKVLAGIAAKPGASAEKTTTSAAVAAKPPEPQSEYGAKHLLVQYKGSARAAPTITRTQEEAKARAIEAMKKARGGAKFEDVVKEYSDEPGAAQRGGDLGKFRKGAMVPEFQTAVEKLKVGEVSDIVTTQFGYHVIMRTQ
jgi:PPIC-type PPIASE domain